jgi:hypothetical protein
MSIARSDTLTVRAEMDGDLPRDSWWRVEGVGYQKAVDLRKLEHQNLVGFHSS